MFPRSTLKLTGVTVIDTSVAAVTVIVTVGEVTEFSVAVMFVVPTL